MVNINSGIIKLFKNSDEASKDIPYLPEHIRYLCYEKIIDEGFSWKYDDKEEKYIFNEPEIVFEE